MASRSADAFVAGALSRRGRRHGGDVVEVRGGGYEMDTARHCGIQGWEPLECHHREGEAEGETVDFSERPWFVSR